MAVNYEEIRIAQSKFNKKYGTTFDIEVFEQQVNFLDSAVEGSNMDTVYRATMAELYDEAFNHFVNYSEDNEFSYSEILNEFERKIMSPFRVGLEQDDLDVPAPFGGRQKAEYINEAQQLIENMPNKTKASFNAKNYEEGKLTFDDVKKFSKRVMQKESATDRELNTMHSFANAIRERRRNHSWLWKLGHLATVISENSLLKKMDSFILDQCGVFGDKNSEDPNARNAYEQNKRGFEKGKYKPDVYPQYNKRYAKATGYGEKDRIEEVGTALKNDLDLMAEENYDVIEEQIFADDLSVIDNVNDNERVSVMDAAIFDENNNELSQMVEFKEENPLELNMK